MKPAAYLLAAAAGVVLGLAAIGGDSTVRASHPPVPQPLLNCADVTGDGPVAVLDIFKVVEKFGRNDPAWTANATYHPLYDLTTVGGVATISASDIAVAVSDFGLNCASVSPVDTEIAQATLAILNKADPPGGAVCPGSALMTQNQTCLEEHGYYQSSFDVPGQGIHWVNGTYFEDDIYDPTKPEGLVYKGGKLLAQLYFIDGNTVGWGPEPPPIENVDIDPFCTPVSGDRCSWFGPYDGWHLHTNLCTIHIGTPQASNTFTSSAAQCEEINGGVGEWRWNARVGWMGHMWNHMLNPNPNPLDVAGNGRFSDCIPDPFPGGHWNGFNCPQ